MNFDNEKSQEIVNSVDLNESEKVDALLGMKELTKVGIEFLASVKDDGKIARALSQQEMFPRDASETLITYCYDIFDTKPLPMKLYAIRVCKALLKTHTITDIGTHVNKLGWFLVNLPNTTDTTNYELRESEVMTQLTLDKPKVNVVCENRKFSKKEMSFTLNKTTEIDFKPYEENLKENLLFLCASSALEYLCDFSIKQNISMKSFARCLVESTAGYFTNDMGTIDSFKTLVDFCVSAVAFLSLVKSTATYSFINLSFIQLKEWDYRNKKKLLYILLQTKTTLTKSLINNMELLLTLNRLFKEGDLKAMFLDVLMFSKAPEHILDKLLVEMFKGLTVDSRSELIEKIITCHVHLLNQSPSYIRIQYSANVCHKITDYMHNSKASRKSTVILKLIQTVVGYMVHTKMMIGSEERVLLSEFFMTPIKLNMVVKDFYNIFTHLKPVEQQFIIKSCAEPILIKYGDRFKSWSPLLEIELFSMVLCLAANKIVLNDLCFGRYNYMNLFPICYQFFNYDKKYYTTMFQHYFPKIINLVVKIDTNHLVTTKRMCTDISKMFASISTTSYTGYYVIFNHFKLFVEELYSLYTLTNDGFYLKTLFNIPISLGLLISKCSLIRNPMEQGIKTECLDVVLPYLDYMIEFDANGEYNELLNYVFILLKHTQDRRIINICNKFTTLHREHFNEKVFENQGCQFTNDILVGFDSYLILRNNNEEIELQFIRDGKSIINEEYIKELYIEKDSRITRENILFKLICNGRIEIVEQLLQDWQDKKHLVNIFHWGLIYAFDTVKEMLDHPVIMENIYFIYDRLIETIYSQNDLLSNRVISVILDMGCVFLRTQQDTLTLALKFKLLHTKSSRVFYAIRKLFEDLFVVNDYKMIFMKVFDKDTYRTKNSFMKSMYLYFEYQVGLGPTKDIVKDLDPEFLLNGELRYYDSLYEHVEAFIRHVNDKSKFVKFFNFYEKMKKRSVLDFNNNIDFEEFIKPVKRFLPGLAVIDGFIDLTAKEDFVESINKNEKISTDNSSSIEVFRNLLFNSTFRLTRVFIELFNTQTYYYKNMIYQLLLNLHSYDLMTLEFLILNETFNQKKHINIQKYLHIDDFMTILVEKMDYSIVRESFFREKDYIMNNTELLSKINNKIVYLLGCTVKKLSYYLLEYLMLFNIKYKNNKVVMEAYINTMYSIKNGDTLIKFHWKNLSVEEREYILQNNPYLVVTDIDVEEDNEINNFSFTTIPEEAVNFEDLTALPVRNLNGLITTGIDLGLFRNKSPINDTTDLYDPDLVQRRKTVEFKGRLDSISVYRIKQSQYRIITKEKIPTEKQEEPKPSEVKITTPFADYTIVQINKLLVNNTVENAAALNGFLSYAVETPDKFEKNLLLAIFKILLGYNSVKIDAFDKLIETHALGVTKILQGGVSHNSLLTKEIYKLFYLVPLPETLRLLSIYASCNNWCHFFMIYPEMVEKYPKEFVQAVIQGDAPMSEKLIKLRNTYDLPYDIIKQRDLIVFLGLAISGKKVGLESAIKRDAILTGGNYSRYYYGHLVAIPNPQLAGVRLIFELVFARDDLFDYYRAVSDKKLFYGLVKYTANIREIKIIAQKILQKEINQAYLLLREVIGKITNRLSSYTKRDLITLKIMNFDILRKLYRAGLKEDEYVNHILEFHLANSTSNRVFDFTDRISYNFISNFVNYNNGISLDEDLWIMIGYLPQSDAFNRSILYLGLLGEMIESKKIKEEFINGRFKMWMNRYPSGEFILYNKWRSFIFNNYTNNKVNSLICKIKCLYAEKLMDDGLYKQAQLILNEINKLSSIELNQNLHKTILDIKCCQKQGEKSTAIDIINSINVSRYTNEDKSRLYFLKYENSGEEYYYNLSKSLMVLNEHKKKDLKDLSSLVGTEGYNEDAHRDMLVDLINDLSIADSRPFVLKLLRLISVGDAYPLIKDKSKLYWFKENKNETMDYLKTGELLYSPLPLMNELDRIRDDYTDIEEIYTYTEKNGIYEVILTSGKRKYIQVFENEETRKRTELVEMIQSNTEEKNEIIVKLNREIAKLKTRNMHKCMEMLLYTLRKDNTPSLPINSLIISSNPVKEITSIGNGDTANLKSVFNFEGINEWYVFKKKFIEEYSRLMACFMYFNAGARGVSVDFMGHPYVHEVMMHKGSTMPMEIQEIFGMDGINGLLINILIKSRNKLKNSSIKEYCEYFEVEGEIYDSDIEKYLNTAGLEK